MDEQDKPLSDIEEKVLREKFLNPPPIETVEPTRDDLIFWVRTFKRNGGKGAEITLPGDIGIDVEDFILTLEEEYLQYFSRTALWSYVMGTSILRLMSKGADIYNFIVKNLSDEVLRDYPPYGYAVKAKEWHPSPKDYGITTDESPYDTCLVYMMACIFQIGVTALVADVYDIYKLLKRKESNPSQK